MGELRRRGRIWWLRWYVDGRRYEESSRSTSHDVAKNMLKTQEGAVSAGAPVAPHVGRLRFEDAATDVVNDYKANKRRSLGDLERRLKLHLTPYFGHRRMVSIGTSDVLAYTAERLKAGASNAQINRELAVLKRMFVLATESKRLVARPHIPMLVEDNVRTGFFEREQFDSVRAHLPAELRGVVTLAYYSGWRIGSEVLPLTWAQVDRTAAMLRLEPGTTKNKKGRTFPYLDVPEVKAAVDAAWTEHEAMKRKGTICPFVFHRGGERVKSLRGAWAAATKAAGCPGRVPHDLRRTAVRNFVRSGTPEKTAMTLTGHKTRSVFDRYDIVSEADLSAATRRLGAWAPAAGTGTVGR